MANSLLKIVDTASPCLSGSDHTNDVVRTKMYVALYTSRKCVPHFCVDRVQIYVLVSRVSDPPISMSA